MHRYNGRCPECNASVSISAEDLSELVNELQNMEQDPQSFHCEHCEGGGMPNYGVDITIGGKKR